ncbi:MAG: ribonuclease P protein subunit [Desulfurococcaceae archaeon]|jgi:ribonuclease P protein subunit POP4|nr:ribonuclease P protein subunit [Desulfurococcaceae archaeon]
MKITPNNILCHELIGLEIKLLQYTDPALIGLSGIIVDETLKTFIIERSDGKKLRVFKANGVFELKIPSGQKVTIVGEDIMGRPWDRLKKYIRKCRG